MKRARVSVGEPATVSASSSHVVLKTSNQFRTRLVCSVLSLHPVVMTGIREDEEEPGLNESELCFARCVALACHGSKLVINETGTRVTFTPGMLSGGKVVVDDVHPEVNLGWIVEGFLPLTPFFKAPLRLELAGGLTDEEGEVGINHLRNVSLKLLQKFTGDAGLLECRTRGFSPDAGGAITLTCPTVRKHLQIPTDLDSSQLRVLKIRGTAQASRVNPQLANRLATASRSKLEEFATDVFINTDCRSSRTKDCGASPGYSLSVWAEFVDPKQLKEKHVDLVRAVTVLGASGCYSAESKETPEALAVRVSNLLLDQIAHRGCVDAMDQTLLLLLMACCPEQIIKANVGKTLAPHAVQALRVIKQFLGVKFHLAVDPSTDLVHVSCLGNGVGNIARNVT